MARLTYEIPSALAERWRCDPEERTRVQIETKADYFEIVSLAREHNILAILPCALYCCVYHCVQEGQVMRTILRGAPRQDGSIVELSYADKEICLLGWEKILKLQDNTYRWATSSGGVYGWNGCMTPDICATARARHRPGSSRSMPSCDLFGPWSNSWANGMCKNCVQSAKTSHYQACVDAWEQLPSVFELPSWKVLLNKD